ncbi:hypothetical protein LENED_012219 [Lentinula edodes]|uniref:Uncharacterized protein n=1 Tax=Lentinula edodes TaxID=5353 RepID=A0A1Q3ES06_LENED|nr:hypothetical protein LENED_012219 [Lentinula edodes]
MHCCFALLRNEFERVEPCLSAIYTLQHSILKDIRTEKRDSFYDVKGIRPVSIRPNTATLVQLCTIRVVWQWQWRSAHHLKCSVHAQNSNRKGRKKSEENSHLRRNEKRLQLGLALGL